MVRASITLPGAWWIDGALMARRHVRAMTSSPDQFPDLDLADQRRLAAFKLELGGFGPRPTTAVYQAADLLEQPDEPVAFPTRESSPN